MQSSITFNLTDNGATVKGIFENLTLTGAGAINGTGNALNNAIHGNDAVSFVSKLDGHDVISNFDGNATGGQDTVDLDGLFDSLGVAAPDRGALVTVGPGGGAVTFDVHVDVSALHDGSQIITFATLNTADAITVGQDVLVGT